MGGLDIDRLIGNRELELLVDVENRLAVPDSV